MKIYEYAKKLMDKDDIIKKLKKHEQELRQKGVVRAAVFGSYVKEQQEQGSDIDILIELNPECKMGIFSYVALKEYIASFFDYPVDVVNKEALKKEVRKNIEKEAIYAF